MSQQILSYINQINLRLEKLEKANEALAARVRELETSPAYDPVTAQAAVNNHIRVAVAGMVKRGPGRPRKDAPANGTD